MQDCNAHASMAEIHETGCPFSRIFPRSQPKKGLSRARDSPLLVSLELGAWGSALFAVAAAVELAGAAGARIVLADLGAAAAATGALVRGRRGRSCSRGGGRRSRALTDRRGPCLREPRHRLARGVLEA